MYDVNENYPVKEDECRKILMEIQKIVKDDTIDDPECFWKIEKLVCLFEKHCISCGGRHDF